MRSLASRRALRMAILHSSPMRRTTLTRSRRRSSVSGGMGRRMIEPSFWGLSPSSDDWIAFSISPMIDLSHGWTVSSRGSGAAMVATCFSGTFDPK